MNNLNEIEKKNPFLVPDGYFEQLSQNIMANLPEKEEKTAQKITLWKKVEPWIYLAAMFFGAFFMIQVFHTTIKKDKSDDNIIVSNHTVSDESYWSTVQISEEEFYEYLEEQLINDGYYDYVYNEVMFQ